MCGIAGKLAFDPGATIAPGLIRRMTAAIRHRGPDDEGVWVDGSVGLGNRRLAIIDLSPRARQPMTNEDGTLHVTFNGEIYNFQALRPALERGGHTFRSEGDTETILHLYEEEGINCLRHLRGMFAFGLWDARRRTLLLARDRLGKKPLFYHHGPDGLVFASEPKAILQDPTVPAEPDVDALHHFLTYGYVPNPRSAFLGIRKLPPAHYALVRDGRVTVERYWSLAYSPKRTEPEPALAEELMSLLHEAVRLRLVSDVPIGVLLSGGLDSSAIVALMRQAIPGRVRTFSIGFDEPAYDELAHARRVARHFETEHRELVVKPDAVSLLPRLAWHFDEPFGDSSALPTFLICEMARESVTVALNGDGGDESFLGYDRYRAVVLGDWYDRIPAPVRGVALRAALALPHGTPKSRVYGIRRLAEALGLPPTPRYARWLTVFDDARKRTLYTADFGARVAGIDTLDVLADAFRASAGLTDLEAAAHADLQHYLPDDLLVKMDIASMAHSLEVRSPFLDHRVVEFAAALPANLKLRGLTQKYLLKRVMRDVLPRATLRRPKMGFGVPIDHWFRHELREVAHDLLLDARARQRGYFRPEEVARYLDEHARGEAHHHNRLWALLMLELWHRTFIDRPGADRPLDGM
ncbi:MAG TPA: asparagine synthase (glutamine-hydrolyzing) [Methylomirabilota bacterium]|nr:asparagine synthase (glutamine-hydrolyzing) [Methylomirabilota bacterium]